MLEDRLDLIGREARRRSCRPEHFNASRSARPRRAAGVRIAHHAVDQPVELIAGLEDRVRDELQVRVGERVVRERYLVNAVTRTKWLYRSRVRASARELLAFVRGPHAHLGDAERRVARRPSRRSTTAGAASPSSPRGRPSSSLRSTSTAAPRRSTCRPAPSPLRVREVDRVVGEIDARQIIGAERGRAAGERIAVHARCCGRSRWPPPRSPGAAASSCPARCRRCRRRRACGTCCSRRRAGAPAS